MTTFSSRETGILWPKGTVNTVLTPEITDEHKLVSNDLLHSIKSLKRGQFMLDERYLPDISKLAITAQFNEIEEHGKTREASGREVSFGQLILNSDDDGEHSLAVAFKPFFESEAQIAAHEYAVSSYFASDNIRDITSYTPFGMYRSTNGMLNFISEYRHSVRSLDTIFWNPDLVGDQLITSKALGRAALSLATLHNRHWTHGDAQAKNFAWDITRSEDESFIIDVETTEPFPIKVGEVDLAHTDAAIRYDLEKFISSLYNLKATGFALPEGYNDWIKESFCLEYASKLVTGNTIGTNLSFERLEEIVEEQSNF